MSEPASEAILDCDAGRALGCASFCCRLLVRLRLGERAPRTAEGVKKSCVDKDPHSGLCVWFDAQSGRCKVWDERPSICREYDCNRDPLLQVVLRDGFVSLVALVRAEPPRAGETRRVPSLPRAAASNAETEVT